MRNCVPARLVLAIAATALSALPVGATLAKRTNLSDSTREATPAGQAVEALTLAYRLADHARAVGDARTMIVAARIMASAPVGDVEGGRSSVMSDAQALYAEAARLAGGDTAVLTEIEGARAEEAKGVLCGRRCGAIRTIQQVSAGSKWTVRLAARGGEPLIVGIRREGETGMDLKLYDEFGNLVCQDLSQGPTLYCRANPIWTGPFFAVVINHGARAVAVSMVTN
jgi:hypothetical protein